MKKNYFKVLIFTMVMLATLGTYAQQTICVGATKNYSVNTPGTGPAIDLCLDGNTSCICRNHYRNTQCKCQRDHN